MSQVTLWRKEWRNLADFNKS